VRMRSSAKDQVHAVLAKLGIPVPCSDLFGAFGLAWLDGLSLPQPYAGKITSLRQLIGWLTAEAGMLDEVIADFLGGHPPYQAVLRLPGIGPVLAAVVIAEIGDVSRFPGPGQLCSWAGLTPRHRESDVKVARGHITKQGSPVLRWAMVEAIQHQPAGSPPRELKDAITLRRGSEAKNIAKVAAARKLLTCVFYAMRDGEVRSLAGRGRAAQAG
jgi:transposase